RRNDGAGNAALDRAERGESSAAESLLLVLHKIENRGIAADSRDGAKRAEIQAIDVRAANEFLVAVGDVNAVDEKRQAVAASQPVGKTGNNIGEILLRLGGKRGIVHALDFETPLLAVCFAEVDEFLAQVRGADGIGGLEKQITACGLRRRKQCGARVTIGLQKIRAGTRRHPYILQYAIFHDVDLLAAHTFIIHVITAEKRLALEIFRRGIIGDGNVQRQDARAHAAGPFAVSAHLLQHLIEGRNARKRWTRAGKRRLEGLREHGSRSLRVQKNRAFVVRNVGSRAE